MKSRTIGTSELRTAEIESPLYYIVNYDGKETVIAEKESALGKGQGNPVRGFLRPSTAGKGNEVKQRIERNAPEGFSFEGQEVSYNEDGSVQPVQFSMAKFVAYLALEAQTPIEAQFQSPVGPVEKDILRRDRPVQNSRHYPWRGRGIQGPCHPSQGACSKPERRDANPWLFLYDWEKSGVT